MPGATPSGVTATAPPAAADASAPVDVLALRFALWLGGKQATATPAASGVLSKAELTEFLARWDPSADDEEVRRVFSLHALGEVVRQAALLPLEGGTLSGSFERDGARIDLELEVHPLAARAAVVAAKISRNGELLSAPQIALGYGSRAVLSTQIPGDSTPFVFVVVEVDRTTRSRVSAESVRGAPSTGAKMVDGVAIKAPRALESPEPVVPEEAKKGGFEGTATVAVTIAADGRVEKAVLVKDPGHGLGSAAVEAATLWRFEPPTENGKPVRATMVLTFRF